MLTHENRKETSQRSVQLYFLERIGRVHNIAFSMTSASSSSKAFQEDPGIKFAEHIMEHLGLSRELPFDMLTKDDEMMIGNRLELILGMVHLFH